MSASRRKLIIDCDPGNDDTMAIFMALNSPDVDVIAITCVDGNTTVKQTGLNALRVLQAADRPDIPVFVGCDKPLLGDRKPRTIKYHGNDGLGDVPDANAPDESCLQKEHAVQAMLRLSNQHPGDINLVAIGPLTNVAMAIRIDPDFGHRLKCCSIMGGNYLGKGNITSAAEFNFYADPEAASVVLNQLQCPITLMPWETCMKHAISMETHALSRSYNTKKAKLINAVDMYSLARARERGSTTFIPADEAIMACVVSNDVIKSCVHVYATVETKGEYTSGQVVVDWNKRFEKEPNVTIVTELDQSLYEDIMNRSLK